MITVQRESETPRTEGYDAAARAGLGEQTPAGTRVGKSRAAAKPGNGRRRDPEHEQEGKNADAGC